MERSRCWWVWFWGFLCIQAGLFPQTQKQERLALPPFTGGQARDGEYILSGLARQRVWQDPFQNVPLVTSTTRAFMNFQQRFQRDPGMTDADTIFEMGKRLGTAYVIAGCITALGDRNLAVVNILDGESLQEIAGDYRPYRKLAGLPVPPFEVTPEVNQGDAQVLTQNLANRNKYPALPRTDSLDKTMEDRQRTGETDQDRVKPLGVERNAQFVLAGSVPAGFVRIEGGTFLMGSPPSEAKRFSTEAAHTVGVSGFYLGKYEATQREYEAVMGANPSSFKGPDLPVESVSWYDAAAYCNQRSEHEGLTPAYSIDKGRRDPNNKNSDDPETWVVTWNRSANGYRLPAEAEWEYACRAGSSGPFNRGNNITTAQANYDGNYPYHGNAKGTYREKTTAAGSFPANQWGLYDMHGNVYEWRWDWYGSYRGGSPRDPAGPASGSYRVLRGGSWYNYAQNLRSASRSYYGPSYRYGNLGFRLVRAFLP